MVRRDIVFDSDGSQHYKETNYDCECDCWTQYQVVVGYRYSDEFDGYETDELDRWVIDSGCGPPPDISPVEGMELLLSKMGKTEEQR